MTLNAKVATPGCDFAVRLGQIVEIVASIALFGYLNRWNDTMATQLEALPTSVAAKTIGNIGWDAGKHI